MTGRWTNKTADEVKRLYMDGLTYSQIAERMGVSRSAISGLLFRCARNPGGLPQRERVRHCRWRKKPEGTYETNDKPKIPVQFEQRLFDRIAEWAQAKDVSFNGAVRLLCEQSLEAGDGR